MVGKLTKPWLLLPAKLAHDLSPIFINLHGQFFKQKRFSWQSLQWRNLEFCNPLGIAGGVDKNAEQFRSWWTFGAGFVEVGTITPQAQVANAGQIIERDLGQQAVWNKMGFPNKGLEHAVKMLSGLSKPHFTPIFVNIGKNRQTPNETAAQDYIKCLRELSPYADVFVINISSPNTLGLRDLMNENKLGDFLSQVLAANTKKIPVLLKLSPDLDQKSFYSTIDTSLNLNIDGWVITNTTLERESGLNFPVAGGVSGRPLASKSKEYLQMLISHLGTKKQDKLIVSCGGILSPDDTFDRLKMGADLVQVYSALIFNGPNFFRNVADKAAAVH